MAHTETQLFSYLETSLNWPHRNCDQQPLFGVPNCYLLYILPCLYGHEKPSWLKGKSNLNWGKCQNYLWNYICYPITNLLPLMSCAAFFCCLHPLPLRPLSFLFLFVGYHDLSLTLAVSTTTPLKRSSFSGLSFISECRTLTSRIKSIVTINKCHLTLLRLIAQSSLSLYYFLWELSTFEVVVVQVYLLRCGVFMC